MVKAGKLSKERPRVSDDDLANAWQTGQMKQRDGSRTLGRSRVKLCAKTARPRPSVFLTPPPTPLPDPTNILH